MGLGVVGGNGGTNQLGANLHSDDVLMCSLSLDDNDSFDSRRRRRRPRMRNDEDEEST